MKKKGFSKNNSLSMYEWINQNKILAGLAMLFLNIGARFVNLNLTPKQEILFKKYIRIELFIFSMFWVGSRDIFIAILLTLVYLLFVRILFNDESAYCISKRHMDELYSMIDTNKDNIISEKEIKNAIEVLHHMKPQVKENDLKKEMNKEEDDNEMPALYSYMNVNPGLMGFRNMI